MTFGLTSLNETGQTLIDQDYMNVSLVSKGTIASLSASSFGATYLGNPSLSVNAVFWVIDITGTTPVLAVKPPDGVQVYPNFSRTELNTSNPPPTGYRRFIFWKPGTTSTNLTWYLFDAVGSNLPNSAMGMKVINSGGVTVFNSSAAVIKIKQLLTLSYSNIGTNYTKPSSASYAYVFANNSEGNYYPASSSNRYMFKIGFYPTSSTNVQIVSAEELIDRNFLSAGPLFEWPAPGFMIDVTGY